MDWRIFIMKIAVTYDNGNVFQHFGKTENFKVYEVEDDKVVSSEVIGSNGTGHGALAGLLAEQGINVLICGGIGEGAQTALTEAGIEMVAGAQGNTDDVVEAYLKGERFLLTYGDGLSTINIPELIAFHKKSGKIATLTAVQPEGKFGALGLTEYGVVTSFREKPRGDGVWINGGFMVCEPGIFDHIPANDDGVVFETGPLRALSDKGELAAYRHRGFWHAMDTLKDRRDLEQLWKNHTAPWALWEKDGQGAL